MIDPARNDPATNGRAGLFPMWLWYSLFAVLAWGVFGFLSKLGADRLPSRTLQIWFTLGIATSVAPAIWRTRGKLDWNRKGAASGVAIGLVAVFANLMFFSAMEKGQASIVGTAVALYPIVTVGLTFWLLGERLNRWQAAGAGLAVAAIALMSS